MRQLAIATIAALAAPMASAGGFAVGAQSAEGLAESGAITAKPELESAGFYNPAAIADEEGIRAYGGTLLVVPRFTIEDPDSGQIDRPKQAVDPIPHLFASYMGKKAGVVLYVGAPHGSGLEYEEDWRGRNELTSVDLKAIAVNPNLVYKVSESLSFAAGPSLVTGLFGLETVVDLVGDEAGLTAEASSMGLGATASALYKASDTVRIGATFRSPVRLTFEGTADFHDVPTPFAGTLVDQNVQSTITLPARAALGIYYTEARVGAGLDLEYNNWSTFDTLVFDFEDDDLDQTLVRNWHDTVTFRAGGSYMVNEGLKIRGGFLIDPSVSPESTLTPQTPDATRIGASLGTGMRLGKVSVDAGYLLLTLLEHASTGEEAFPAVYSGFVHVGSVSAGYRW